MERLINIISKRFKDFEIWQERKIVRVIEESEGLKKTDNLSSLNTAIRVFEDGKKGFLHISGDYLDESLIIENIKFSLDRSFKDDGNILPTPNIKDGDAFNMEKGMSDDSFLKEKLESVFDKAKEYSMVKKIERVSVNGEETEVCFFNSKKGYGRQKNVKYALGTVLVVERDRDEKIEWDYVVSDNLHDIEGGLIFDRAYKRAVKLLNSSPMQSGRYPLLFENRAACEFLEIIAKSFIAENVYKKKSIFDNNCNLSEKLTIIDDPLIKDGSIKYFFDGEGFLTSAKRLMVGGEVKDFLYDSYYGIKLGKSSNGSSIRAKISSPPQNGYSNIYIEPAKEDNIYKVLKDMDNVICIVNLIGMHLVNPVSGEFSVGFDGYLLKKGDYVKALSQSTISGNIKELFKNVVEIGSDMSFYGNTGSPSMLFSSIVVSGV